MPAGFVSLSALAVMLGVSFVAGTYVLTDTLDRSFTNVFDQTVSGVDLVVRLRVPFGGDSERDRFPDALVAQVARVHGVATATGFLEDYAQIVDKSGNAIQTAGAPTFGIAWGQHGRDGPLGRSPTAPLRAARRTGSGRSRSTPERHARTISTSETTSASC